MPINEILKIEDFQVGSTYSRKTVADTGKVPRPKQDRDWSGIVSFKNCILLFVTLDKTGFEKSNQYHDVFDRGGTVFFWDSQRRNTAKTPAIARIIDGDAVIVFVRIAAKIRSKTQPFTYVGKLDLTDCEGEKPVQMVFDVADHLPNPPENLQDIYDWEPEGRRKLRPIEIDTPKTATPTNDKKRSKSGQGRLLDPAKKKAIELRAMAVASDHYEKLGYDIEDTSANSSFDLLCSKPTEMRRVEVKGTTQAPHSVNVTANEVESARDNDVKTDLFVVYDITVYKQAGDFYSEGGDVRLIEDWHPNDEHLTPTQYVYRLPA